MPPVPTTPSGAPRPDPLRAVAELLDLANLDRPGNLVAQVVGATFQRPDDDLELRLLPLGDVHPLEALDRWCAPADCSAVVVRATGRARHLDGMQGPAPVDAVAVTLAVDRCGQEASVLRRGTEASAVDGPVSGLLADACRRALDLPTAAAPASTAALWDALWLDRLLDRAVRGPGAAGAPWGWLAAAGLHPAVAGIPPADPAALAAACSAHAAAHPWSSLRRRADDADLGPAAMDRELATWLDDGAFARRCLSALGRSGDLLDDLELLVPASLGRQLRAAVGARLDRCDDGVWT